MYFNNPPPRNVNISKCRFEKPTPRISHKMKIHNPQASAMLFLTREGVGLRFQNPNAGASNQFQRLAGGCGRRALLGEGCRWREMPGQRAPLSSFPWAPRGRRCPCPLLRAPLRPHWGHHPRAPVGGAPRRLSSRPGQLEPQTRQHRGGGEEGGGGEAKGVSHPDSSGKIRKRGDGCATGTWGAARRTKRPWSPRGAPLLRAHPAVQRALSGPRRRGGAPELRAGGFWNPAGPCRTTGSIGQHQASAC